MNKNIKTPKHNKPNILHFVIRFFFGFLFPFVVINGIILFLYIQTPVINVVDTESKDYDENIIKFTIDSLLPISDIKAFFEDTEVAYTKMGGIYSVNADSNGTYQIKVTSINGATSNQYVQIEARDNIAPIINIEDAIITGNTLTISIYDTESGINYENLYATLDDGSVEEPTYVDKSSGTVKFTLKSKITIHVEDVLGNSAERTFSKPE